MSLHLLGGIVVQSTSAHPQFRLFAESLRSYWAGRRRRHRRFLLWGAVLRALDLVCALYGLYAQNIAVGRCPSGNVDVARLLVWQRWRLQAEMVCCWVLVVGLFRRVRGV